MQDGGDRHQVNGQSAITFDPLNRLSPYLTGRKWRVFRQMRPIQYSHKIQDDGNHNLENCYYFLIIFPIFTKFESKVGVAFIKHFLPFCWIEKLKDIPMWCQLPSWICWKGLWLSKCCIDFHRLWQKHRVWSWCNCKT